MEGNEIRASKKDALCSAVFWGKESEKCRDQGIGLVPLFWLEGHLSQGINEDGSVVWRRQDVLDEVGQF